MSAAGTFGQEYESLLEACRIGLSLDVDKIVSRWATDIRTQDFLRRKSYAVNLFWHFILELLSNLYFPFGLEGEIGTALGRGTWTT